MTTQELAALKALVVAEEARHNPPQLSDSSIADAAALGEEPPMCKITGPYKERKSWRVRIVDTLTGKRTHRFFQTEDEAKAAIPKLVAEYRRPVGVPVQEALDAYQAKLHTRQRKPTSRTAETAIGRIRSVLVRKQTADTDLAIITGEINRDNATTLWSAYRARQTHSGRIPSPDSQVNTLKALRAFWAFLVAKGWAKSDIWTGIEVDEKRHAGKPRLRKDDAKALYGLALNRAKQGDEGATLTLMALLLGLRASEIVDRVAGDIDAGGTELIVSDAKTEAGNRTLMLPEVLQPLVAKLAAGKARSERLFGDRDRHWAYREVIKLCADAGVERVTPHGLRGTASSIGQTAGMLGQVVAQSLGHTSYATTLRHYTDPSAPANAQIARTVAALGN